MPLASCGLEIQDQEAQLNAYQFTASDCYSRASIRVEVLRYRTKTLIDAFSCMTLMTIHFRYNCHAAATAHKILTTHPHTQLS